MNKVLNDLFDYLEDDADIVDEKEKNTEEEATDENKEEAATDEVDLTPADEAAIFLAVLKDTCTPEEYNRIVMESAVELELYGLINSASIATEARKYVVKMSKQTDLKREEKKACLRIAKAKNDATYVRYAKARKLMIESRQQLFNKYSSQAKSLAKKAINNSRRKATSMNSSTGRDIVKKLDAKTGK